MPEQPYVVPIADLSNLKTKGGEYTEESINQAYTTEKALFNVVKNYKQYCQGRKTIVFSASTIQNEAVYNSFIVNGVQEVRMYDSVNTPNDDREDLVAWFRDTPEAVLCNVNVFTTGFDVTDVGAIIVNRPTQSLSLWIQMVGRGARPAFDKGKTDFIVIDGGENIARLNEWSSSIRNWESIFQNGFKPDRAKREVLEEVNTCPACGEYMPKSALICDACGYEIQKKVKEKKVSEQLAVPIKLAEKPNWVKIIRYCKRINQGQIFALQLMTNQIVDLFRTHQVTKETYLSTLENGKCRHSLMAIIRPVYGAIINSDLPSKKNRTLEFQYNLVIKAINKHYGIS
jgi:superfamily II DNA helicase RecQ